MTDPISVGLGEKVISQNMDDILVAYGLGSCLGIGMFDPNTKISGLMHAVLPEKMNGADNPTKYVDSGIQDLLDLMIKAGASKNRIIVKMAGGANMLTSPGFTKTFDIGTRNIQSAHRTLERLNMHLHKEDVGGNTGRTVRIYVITGRMTVKMIGGREVDL